MKLIARDVKMWKTNTPVSHQLTGVFLKVLRFILHPQAEQISSIPNSHSDGYFSGSCTHLQIRGPGGRHNLRIRFRPCASTSRRTAPGISSSKLGQPQNDSNLSSERYSGASQRLQMYKPCALLLSNEPVNGRSVPLYNITLSSSGVI